MDGACRSCLESGWNCTARSGRDAGADGSGVAYRALIDWLEVQEKDEALSYWREYVAGYESQAGLPQERDLSAGNEYEQRETVLTVEEAMTTRLEEVAKRYV